MSLDHLNQLRQQVGISPLKSWKESKDKLHAAILKIEEKLNASKPASVPVADLDSTQHPIAVANKQSWDFTDKDGNKVEVTKCAPSSELKSIQSRNKQLDEIATKRAKGETTAKLPKAPKAKPVVKQSKPKVEGAITLADIARELKIDPKVARAKMRRVTVPTEHVLGKYAYKPASKEAIIALLKGDLRKK